MMFLEQDDKDIDKFLKNKGFIVQKFTPNDPPVSGYDRLFGRAGFSWKHSCGRDCSLLINAIAIGYGPYCTKCGVGPLDWTINEKA